MYANNQSSPHFRTSPAMARLLVLALLLVLATPRSEALPVVAPVTKDLKTSLYTIPFHDGATLVLDTAGPLVWTTCRPDHIPAALHCTSPTCKLAKAFPFPGCRSSSGSCPPNSHNKCTVYPYNPVTGACAAGDLSHTRFVANTTDGRNPLRQVSVKAIAACVSPKDDKKLLEKLPLGSAGVAGLAGTGLALPAQVAGSQRLAKKFLLCLSRGGVYGPGVAVFGAGGPLYLLRDQPEYTQSLQYTPLAVTKKGSPAYHVSVKSILLENAPVKLPKDALATGGAVLCTRTPYTLLRRDVYRPFAAAFEAALAKQIPWAKKARSPVKQLKLCYDATTLPNGLSGYLVPSVALAMEGGGSWTMTGSSSMVDVRPGTACLAFVEMEGVKEGDGSAPAVLVGGFQMDNFVLQFDLEKKRLGFLRLPVFTQCGHFNFTRSG